ncbi:MAG TPA: 4-hydroxy-tetrahydrodipicolinate reductase [Chthoniobacterales bacterium]|nr:4-hydroxy-tetrahydrodipicolinate reductase [Chthoniobacterales bacterium]
MTPRVRVLLVGAAGRMGQTIKRIAESQAETTITAECDLGDILDHSILHCDVVIDFSHADATERNCAACIASEKPLVIGTTGHTPAQVKLIEDTAKSVPVLLAANFSVGVNTLFWLTRKAAELLGPGFDLEVVEMHHRLKKDAPSGTAKRLAQILSEVRGLEYDKHVTHGREGQVGERPAEQIGVHAIRGGDVVGDHTVVFAAPGERLELTHKASSRETFAIGALRAARWIVGRPAQLYSMEDVLGLSAPK